MEVSSKGKSVSLKVDFWFDSKDGKIHMSTNDKDPATFSFHVAVGDDGSRVNGHPSLFKNLAKCLRAKGAPAPPEAEPAD